MSTSVKAVIVAFAGMLSCAATAWAAAPVAVEIERTPSLVSIVAAGRTVLSYTTGASPMKPYAKTLTTPGGVQILRDSPFDHKHHHSLMFAVAVDGVDFWSEKPACGHQKPRGPTDAKLIAGEANGGVVVTQVLDWMSPAGAKLLDEQRTITVFAGTQAPATLLTWRSRLSVPEGKAEVKLTGSHYFGLGMRFVESMDKAGRFFNSEGTEGPIVRGSERVTPARWCAYTSNADGKPVTVAILDHPQNARRAYFFTMRPFAYLSATINLWKDPLEVKAAAPLDLRYGVAVCDGTLGPEQVERLCRQWTELGR
jgi:hypothetical protein